MLSNFATSWQKLTTRNLKQTQMHIPTRHVSYVRAVPCKI